MEYIESHKNDERPEGCVFCDLLKGESGEERILERTELAFVTLAKYPYNPGHLMVAPVRHIPALGDLDDDESAEVHALTVQSVATLRTAYGPEGFNVGWNLGTVAGGSISGHLHELVVPRWGGDTNFMPVLAAVKVLPEHIAATRARLTELWGT